MIKLVIFVIVCFLISESFQLNFDRNSCLRSERKKNKTPDGHKIIEQSFFKLELFKSEYDLNANEALNLRAIALNHEITIKKILVQALLVEDGRPIGSWDVEVNSNFELIDCENEKVID